MPGKKQVPLSTDFRAIFTGCDFAPRDEDARSILRLVCRGVGQLASQLSLIRRGATGTVVNGSKDHARRADCTSCWHRQPNGNGAFVRLPWQGCGPCLGKDQMQHTADALGTNRIVGRGGRDFDPLHDVGGLHDCPLCAGRNCWRDTTAGSIACHATSCASPLSISAFQYFQRYNRRSEACRMFWTWASTTARAALRSIAWAAWNDGVSAVAFSVVKTASNSRTLACAP